jgi:hypothetical protein
MNANGRVLDLIFGRWRSQILYAGVALGIFDVVGPTPRSTGDVANQLGLDATLTYRLMRALGSLELLHEEPGRMFSLTPAGALLRRDDPQTLRGVTLLEEGPVHYALWTHLPAMVRDGRQNAFVREFGHMAFEHVASDSGYGAIFNEAMTSFSGTQTAWVLEALDGYDFSKVSELCDVAGGHGHLLSHILMRFPHLHGTVLELPSVIKNAPGLWAERMGVADRCRYVGGDMFREVPPADAYMMKMILHDWDDDECVQILTNARRGAPIGGAVFVIEHVVPGPETPHFSKLFDIHMMCWGTGRERTTEEYASLLESAGWRYVTTSYPTSRMMGVVQGVKR